VAPILLLLALVAQDPVQVRARLQQEAIRAGEVTVLRVDVETTGAPARIGSFSSLPPGLVVESTRSFDQRQFGIPGGTRRFISREFVLRARAEGRFRVPSLEVTVDGRRYSTGSNLLTVMPAARAPAEPSGDGEGVVLRAWLDADTVTVGEQVTLEAEALFSPDARLRLRRAPEYEAPSPSGFWIQDVPDRRQTSSRFVGQERYEVQRFSRVLFPLAPGEYEIPPARLEYEVRRGLLYAPETRELESEPLRLVVRPVPSDRPAGYTGAVGRFTLEGRLEPGEVPAGEAAVLTVEIEGVGNVKALPAPALPEIEGIDVFPPSEEAESEIRQGVLRGTKRFSWVLIPRRAGAIEIPGITYAFYDPEADTFDAATLDALRLTVSPGATPPPSEPLALRYLDTEPDRSGGLEWVRTPWFAALQLLPLLALAAALAWRRGVGRNESSRRRLRRDRRAELRALEERATADGARLYADAETFTRTWLARRLQVPLAGAGRPSVLLAAGVPQETASALRSLLDRLNAGRYAPTPPDPETRLETIRALSRLLDRLDREAPFSHSPDAGAARAGSLGLLLMAASGLAASGLAAAADAHAAAVPAGSVSQIAATTPATPEAEFEAGIAAFDAERWSQAIGAFQRYVAVRPADPAGWYNLGTAYHRDGLEGYAVWAWLKVLPLDPRHGDARHNLRVAGAAPELVAAASPPLRLRAVEFLLLAAIAWLATGTFGVLWLTRRRRRAATATGIAFLLAAAFAAAGWASTRPHRILIVVHDASLRAGPNLRAEAVTAVESGTGLAPVEDRGDWVRVRTDAGADGWIETSAIESL
jgi:hypothetical protein